MAKVIVKHAISTERAVDHIQRAAVTNGTATARISFRIGTCEVTAKCALGDIQSAVGVVINSPATPADRRIVNQSAISDIDRS